MRHIWSVGDPFRSDPHDKWSWRVRVYRDGEPFRSAWGLSPAGALRMAWWLLARDACQTPVRIGDLGKHPERWQYDVKNREWWAYLEHSCREWSGWLYTLFVYELDGEYGWECHNANGQVKSHAPTLAAAKRAAERAAAEMEAR